MVQSGATEKIPSDTIGNRSRDLPTSSAVPKHYATPGPITYSSVSQPPGRGPVPGPGINYTGPREA